MSDSMRLTDDQITSMLLERVASPMPPDLTAAVLAGCARHTARIDCSAAGLPVRHAPGGRRPLDRHKRLGGRLRGVNAVSTPAPAVVEATAPTEVAQSWTTDSSPAFTVTRDPSDQVPCTGAPRHTT